jgi:hypothetical protein
MLIDVDRLVGAYYDERPDPSDPAQAVSFGTSGHRGTSLAGTFTESHIVAISEAIARYRAAQGITGPGTIWTNAWAAINDGFAEGGYKASGVGRLRGPLAITEFQEAKTAVHSIPPTEGE